MNADIPPCFIEPVAPLSNYPFKHEWWMCFSTIFWSLTNHFFFMIDLSMSDKGGTGAGPNLVSHQMIKRNSLCPLFVSFIEHNKKNNWLLLLCAIIFQLFFFSRLTDLGTGQLILFSAFHWSQWRVSESK